MYSHDARTARSSCPASARTCPPGRERSCRVARRRGRSWALIMRCLCVSSTHDWRFRRWWAGAGSNRRPSAFQADAAPWSRDLSQANEGVVASAVRCRAFMCLVVDVSPGCQALSATIHGQNGGLPLRPEYREDHVPMAIRAWTTPKPTTKWLGEGETAAASSAAPWSRQPRGVRKPPRSLRSERSRHIRGTPPPTPMARYQLDLLAP